MTDAIVVLNAGSSSIKFSLFAESSAELALVARGQAEGIYTAPHFVARNRGGELLAERSWHENARLGHAGALDHLVAYLRERLGGDRLIGVGHRVVHGGIEFNRPVLLNPSVLEGLEKFVPLAPLHQPHNLAPIRLLLERAPDLPQVACFDTSFHRTNPEIAQIFRFHQMVLEDPSMRDEVVRWIQESKFTPEYAVSRTFHKKMKALQAAPSFHPAPWRRL